MKKSHYAILALANLATVAVAAGISFAFEWAKWYLPLILIAAACMVVSSALLAYISSKCEEGSPERTTTNVVSWILLLAGLGLGLWLKTLAS